MNKTIVINRIGNNICIFILFVIFSIGFCVDIYTPKGTSVYVFSRSPELTQAEKNDCALWVQSNYPQAIILQEASIFYNCHSYAWNVSEGGPIYWMNTPEDDKYWNDGSYVQQTNAARGEKVSYAYGDHSAIETTVDDVFDSKWGAYPLCRHARTHCPYDVSLYRVNYYSRYIRAIQNKTYSSGSDVKVASQGTLTVGTNTTVNNGAKVRLASDGAMNLESGFTVQNGAIFTAETW